MSFTSSRKAAVAAGLLRTTTLALSALVLFGSGLAFAQQDDDRNSDRGEHVVIGERTEGRSDKRDDKRDDRRDDKRDDRRDDRKDDKHDDRLADHHFLFTCNLSFHANGHSVYIGVGYTDMYGKGTLSCYDYRNGSTEDIPIKVTARGPGVGLGVTGLVISGGATGIGITRSPDDLLGHYGVIRAGAAVGVGAAGSVGFRLSNGSATLDASVQAQSGLGAGVDLLYLIIEADRDKKPEAPKTAIVAAATPEIPASISKGPLSPAVSAVPVKVVYVTDNQPVQIVDSQGKLLQVVYLKKKN